MFLFFLFPGCMVWVPFALAGVALVAYRYLPVSVQVLLGLLRQCSSSALCITGLPPCGHGEIGDET